MGVKIVAVLSLLSLYCLFNMASILESVIRDHHIYKQIWWPLVREILTLEWEESNSHDKFSSRMLLSLAIFLESFHGCFGTSSGTETITFEVTGRKKRGSAILFILRTTWHVLTFCFSHSLKSSKFVY